jgi:translation initiation factor SUI1
MSINKSFFDPISELDGNIQSDETNTIKKEKVHIRKQQRNRRKCIVTISGLAPYLENSKKNMKKLAKQLQKNITHSSISVKEDKEYGLVMVIQGDWRKEIKNWLLEHKIIENKEKIVLHGD